MDDERVARRRPARGRLTRLGGNPNPVRRNKLLELLPAEGFEQLQPHLEEVEVSFRQLLYEQDGPIAHAYFPHAGVMSLVRAPEHEGGLIVEIATVGNEGMTGLPLVLGGDTMPSMCFCQVAGQAARIAAAPFKELLETCPTLRRLLLRYTQAVLSQVAQTAACNRLHPIEQRCARWLLMTQDRVGAAHFTLTQEFLAQMLGVRRPSVSVAAGLLQKAGLIQYSHGLVVVTDRAGLEAASCNCYRVITDEFGRLLR